MSFPPPAPTASSVPTANGQLPVCQPWAPQPAALPANTPQFTVLGCLSTPLGFFCSADQATASQSPTCAIVDWNQQCSRQATPLLLPPNNTPSRVQFVGCISQNATDTSFRCYPAQSIPAQPGADPQSFPCTAAAPPPEASPSGSPQSSPTPNPKTDDKEAKKTSNAQSAHSISMFGLVSLLLLVPTIIGGI